MILDTLLEGARATPDRPAVRYDGAPFTFAAIAKLVLAARQSLLPLARHAGRIAILDLELLDNWIASLALRSLGVTTLAVPSLETIAGLGSLDIACVLTTATSAAVKPGTAVVRLPLNWRDSLDAAPSHSGLSAGGTAIGDHILLTSGTTGRFKAFPVTAAADAINTASHMEIAGFTTESSVLVCDFGLWTSAGYYVAASVWRAGGCAVIEQGRRWRSALFEAPITHAWLTPFALRQQLDLQTDGQGRRDDLRLIVGGFAMPWSLAERALTQVTSRLFSLIASTETGPWSLGPVSDPRDVVWHPVHPSRTAQIVDGDGRPAAPGETGHVRIQVIDGATGYLADEAASRACFRDGFFHSGDMGQASGDGRIALRGRTTDVVPLNGAKHMAGLFEQALSRLLDVEEVCVFAAPNDQAEEEIHVVLETHRPFTMATLAHAAKTVFPGVSEVRFHRLDALPRSPMGKIRRYALKERLTGPIVQKR